jgi:hypothetical protein
MAQGNRNFVVGYILFVVVPLACLAAVLKGGQKLTAPVAIDGFWSVQADAGQSRSLPCGEALAALTDRPLTISQSGRIFTIPSVGLPAVSSSGTIEGTALRATLQLSPEWAAKNGCATREILLLATVNPNVSPKSLDGSLTVNNSSVEFHALLQAAPASAGRR